jgi:hypothetical protein
VSHNAKWDGLHKQLIQDSLGSRSPEHIHMTKVKAHRQWRNATSPCDEEHIHGNSVADQVADRCVSGFLHDDCAKEKPKHKVIIDQMVVALVEARDQQATIPKPKRTVAAWMRKHRAVKDGERHLMLWNKGGFSCQKCCKRFSTMPKPECKCLGAPIASRGIAATAARLGHVPVVISTDGKRKGLLVLCTKCGAYGADKVVLLAKPCQQLKTKRSGPIGMLEKGRHPICKGSWVDRVWKFIPPQGDKRASLAPEGGYGQSSKRTCVRGDGQGAAEGQVAVSTRSRASDDAHWKELEAQASVTFAQDGDWDLSELAGLFGD